MHLSNAEVYKLSKCTLYESKYSKIIIAPTIHNIFKALYEDVLYKCIAKNNDNENDTFF